METEVQDSTVDLYVQVATAVWLLHEYFITLPDEMRCIWQRRPSGATFIYLTMRYFTLLDQLRLLQHMIHWSNSPSNEQLVTCTAIWRFVELVDVVFYIAVAAFGSIRIYAITERSIKRTALVGGLSLVFICCHMYVSFDGTIVPGTIGSSGCYRLLNSNEEKEPIFGVPFSRRTDRVARAAGAACAFLAEMVIQICTWEKSWKIRRILKRSNITQSFFLLCLRDGTIVYVSISFWFLITFAFCRARILPTLEVANSLADINTRRVYIVGRPATSLQNVAQHAPNMINLTRWGHVDDQWL
ncbi:hypothetical protein NM688_g5383 [Phlebia brevispora]|uniref:Uncharacterized protein n=1 Tax=Phlebia brevispora TaxID=194682 RepID=A0ACC1SVY1_9APHY|nr:hypothetical protein NM688_g5383 [Phlebia brevispora]